MICDSCLLHQIQMLLKQSSQFHLFRDGRYLVLRHTFCLSIPKSVHVCSTNMSYSTKVPRSSNTWIRSLAVNFPFLCCWMILASPPPLNASFRLEAIWSLTWSTCGIDEEQSDDLDTEMNRHPINFKLINFDNLSEVDMFPTFLKVDPNLILTWS